MGISITCLEFKEYPVFEAYWSIEAQVDLYVALNSIRINYAIDSTHVRLKFVNCFTRLKSIARLISARPPATRVQWE